MVPKTVDDPKPCREQDLGKFEVLHRDGIAKLGRLHTAHGPLHTPALLPVINPNIRTIEPRELWDNWGIEGLITNSYIIWKHEKLSVPAKELGVHKLLDFPGVIVCDSGTFQSYIYGDVEVGVEEIIEFQKSIGVDVATMLDVFGRPDMTRQQMMEAVETTIERAEPSINAAEGMMLNGPIQGGLEWDLRQRSAQQMSKYDFAIHPIGGIVPIMEQHRYLELTKIMLASIPHLPASRPVHLFGCGHPMLFPMAIALGADLFDSAAYALFAKDDRLLLPWGTVKLENLEYWPLLTPSLHGWTPSQVRDLGKEERTALLARFNMDVTVAELNRCRQAVKDGTIWELTEMRSHQHPALREAYQWLITAPSEKFGLHNEDGLVLSESDASREHGSEYGIWEGAWEWVIDSTSQQRDGGVSWLGPESHERPWVEVARRLLHSRWRTSTQSEEVLILHGRSGPWRDRIGNIVCRIKAKMPDLEVLIQTPFGLLPWSLEDVNPFAHVEGPSWLHRRRPDLRWCANELSRLGLSGKKIILFDMATEDMKETLKEALPSLTLDADTDELVVFELEREQAISKLSLFANIHAEVCRNALTGCQFIHSRTRRVKNILLQDGRHIASPRLTDGGLSLTAVGAKWAHNLRTAPVPEGFECQRIEENVSQGPPWVVIEDDAVPFIRDGRNVFHGFITAVDAWLRPGASCLIVNSKGELIAHGISKAAPKEMAELKKGIAVRTRDGIKV